MRDTKSENERVRRALEAVRRASEAHPAVDFTGLTRWRQDFHFWVLEQCRFWDRYWTPTRNLHADFCGWNVTRDCDFPTFSALLNSAGFYVEEVRGIAWCYGLVLVRQLTREIAEARRPRRLVDGMLEGGEL